MVVDGDDGHADGAWFGVRQQRTPARSLDGLPDGHARPDSQFAHPERDPLAPSWRPPVPTHPKLPSDPRRHAGGVEGGGHVAGSRHPWRLGGRRNRGAVAPAGRRGPRRPGRRGGRARRFGLPGDRRRRVDGRARASSTSTPTTTPSCCGTHRQPLAAARGDDRDRRELRVLPRPERSRACRLPGRDDGPGGGHAARGLAAGARLAVDPLRGVARPTRRGGSPSTPASWSATRPCGGRSWATMRWAAALRCDLGRWRGRLHRALEEGALGFSTSQAHTHHDGDGDPVPSRGAEPRPSSSSWRAAVRGAPRDHGRAHRAGLPQRVQRRRRSTSWPTLSLLADRPVNWNVLGVSAAESPTARAPARGLRRRPPSAGPPWWPSPCRTPCGSGCASSPAPSSTACRDGGRSWPSPYRADRGPVRSRGRVAGWTRARSPRRPAILGALATWKRLVIDETFAPRQRPATRGARSATWPETSGQIPSTSCSTSSCADELRTGLRPPIGESEADWELRAKVWQDPRTVVGGSDAGAHLDTMCGAIYSTSLLGDGVRQRGLLSWEEAVRQLTDVPARLYGLRDRGRLRWGSWADVVVFDPESVGHGPERTRDDLPGGASRLYAEGVGVEHVLVNGDRAGPPRRLHRATSGSVLRSGRDTDTVTVPGGATYAPPGRADPRGASPSSRQAQISPRFLRSTANSSPGPR